MPRRENVIWRRKTNGSDENKAHWSGVGTNHVPRSRCPTLIDLSRNDAIENKLAFTPRERETISSAAGQSLISDSFEHG